MKTNEQIKPKDDVYVVYYNDGDYMVMAYTVTDIRQHDIAIEISTLELYDCEYVGTKNGNMLTGDNTVCFTEYDAANNYCETLNQSINWIRLKTAQRELKTLNELQI